MTVDMTQLSPTVSTILHVRPPARAGAQPIAELVRDLEGCNRLAIVVIDALGLATWSAFRESTPCLNRLAQHHLLTLHAVLPAITPVNFATMATGAQPQVHKVKTRTDQITVETLFDVLREAGKSSAVAARTSSTLGILLARFADRPLLSTANLDEEVLALALQLLAEDHADFLMVQLLDVDDAGHAHGPQSAASGAAVASSDRHLGVLARELAARDYSLIVLADHGQHLAEPIDNDPLHVGTHSGRLEADVLVPLIWARPEELDLPE
jgi:hypothetical protein